MADINSFLGNGQIPNGSALTATTNQTTAPAWYTDAIRQATANTVAAGARPFQAYDGPRISNFTADEQTGFDQTKAAATSYQPWLAKAGQSSVANIDQYMNPYIGQVVNRIGELGARNLHDNIMPAITSKFINAGQLGSGFSGTPPTGLMTDTARAVRDTSNDILGAQTNALQQGYTQAQGFAANDLSRYGQLGGMAQQYGLAGGAATTGVGAQQRQLNDNNLSIRYGDFLRQNGYPDEQVQKMIANLGGLKAGAPVAFTQQGIAPTGSFAPSTAATIGGTALTLAELAKTFGLKF